MAVPTFWLIGRLGSSDGLNPETPVEMSMSGSGEPVGADAFERLGPAVRSALREREFSTPTDPQRRAIPPIGDGADTLVIAPTGSGKTETAMLPVFDALVQDDEREGLGALYITPLRALNRDLDERLAWWGDQLDLDIQVRHGDTTKYQRQKQAEDPPDVLVTTPETLQAMLTGSRLREGLATVDHVIVDEIHELASSKRGAQLSIGLERLREVAGPAQRIGLSATVGEPEAVAALLTGDRGARIVSVDVTSRLSFAIRHPTVQSGDQELAAELATDARTASHVRCLRELIDAHDSTLIFVNTRQTAEALAARFKALDANVDVHHGSLSKGARVDVEAAFKAGELDALLCTSSMELGIDVGRIDHVIQYQSPREVTRLLQRVGRAGHRVDAISKGTVVATRSDDIAEAMAIVEAARDGYIEPADVHRGSLDTLANQIVGIVMDEGEVRGERVYRIVTRASPFSDLERETVREVIGELAGNGIIWLDREADTLSKTGNTWQYFYDNLSMIPDEASFSVVNLATNGRVGTLDERFVVNFAEPGEVFVQQGEMWRIAEVDRDDEQITVSPVEDPDGEIPSWVGQEIPVPFRIAQRVGEYREGLVGDGRTGPLPRDLADQTAIETVREPIERHQEAEIPLATQNRLVVEGRDGTVVVNACFGHQTNETLGRLLAALLGQRTGSSIGLDVDPYRIDLEVPRSIGPSDVVEVLEETDPDHLRPLIELSLKRSDTLKFKLAQVATSFGALKRWEADTKGMPPARLLAALEDTPIHDEAVRAVCHEELDIEVARKVLSRIQSDQLSVQTYRGRSPIGQAGRTRVSELLAPDDADAGVIETIKERLANDRVRLLCVHCRDWERTSTVKHVDPEPICPACGSTRIAALNPWDEETVDAVNADQKDEEEARATQRAYRAANLVQSHGKQAVIALAARGVGPETAARVIGKLREDEDEFYRDLLEQERQYARTRSFWD